tara:strand:+ start:8788 stop:11214 length:2427 start_codon:yes stop_codon:yes gene_type:complete
MPIENATYVNDLVPTNPLGTDGADTLDQHDRLVKLAVKQSFPGFTGAVIAGGTTSGLVNAYTLSPTTALPSYVENMMVVCEFHLANTGAATINISSLGAKTIKTVSGEDVTSADLLGSRYTALVYDGTNFQLLAITKNYVDQLVFEPVLPAQFGNANKLLTTDATNASWTALLKAATIRFADSTDTTKRLAFDVSGVSTGTTRTAIVPDRDFYLGGIGNATTTTSATNITLTATSAGYQSIAMTALGKRVILPAATTMHVGGPLFVIKNDGNLPYGVYDNASNLLTAILPGGVAEFYLKDINTAAGVWSFIGDLLSPGLIKIDQTFSSTYTDTFDAFVNLTDDLSINFLKLSSGFAAFTINDATGAVGTPVAVITESGAVPITARRVNATSTIVFFSGGSSGTGTVILTESSGSLSVGSPAYSATMFYANASGTYNVPTIAQLTSTSYLSIFTDDTSLGGTNITKVTALTVSGSAISIGTPLSVITTGSVRNSGTVDRLTDTTARIIYLSGSSPYQVNVRVVTVSGTTPTLGAAATVSGANSNAEFLASCLFSSTLGAFLVYNETTDIVSAYATVISGTTTTIGAAYEVENTVDTNTTNYANHNAGLYAPRLFPYSSSAMLVHYFDVSGNSRVFTLTVSALGVIGLGSKLFRSFSTEDDQGQTGYGVILPQGTSEFLTLRQEGISPAWTIRAIPHKIDGVTLTYGNTSDKLPGTSVSSLGNGGNALAARLTGGNYIITSSIEGSGLTVIKSDGSSAIVRGMINIPRVSYPFFGPAKTNGNKVTVLGTTDTGSTPTSSIVRLLNVEVAI